MGVGGRNVCSSAVLAALEQLATLALKGVHQELALAQVPVHMAAIAHQAALDGAVERRSPREDEFEAIPGDGPPATPAATAAVTSTASSKAEGWLCRNIGLASPRKGPPAPGHAEPAGNDRECDGANEAHLMHGAVGGARGAVAPRRAQHPPPPPQDPWPQFLERFNAPVCRLRSCC